MASLLSSTKAADL